MKINGKHYLKEQDIKKFISYLRTHAYNYIVIPYMKYEDRIIEFRQNNFDPTQFDIIEINNSYYWNANAILYFIHLLNLKKYEENIQRHYKNSKDLILTILYNYFENNK